ncbi:hypothetical protein C0992_004819 [Termitomyces sp. T32_za158]|nr:hypothetical protein C0992_004819 [Termitomyces sp. T32_za158]
MSDYPPTGNSTVETLPTEAMSELRNILSSNGIPSTAVGHPSPELLERLEKTSLNSYAHGKEASQGDVAMESFDSMFPPLPQTKNNDPKKLLIKINKKSKSSATTAESIQP